VNSVEVPGGGAEVLAANIMHFVRLLRAAGFTVGTGRTLDAVGAVEAVGVERRTDMFWALHAVLVSRPEDRELFRQAFQIFWRDPLAAPAPLADLLPTVEELRRPRARPVSRRLAEAAGQRPRSAPRGAAERVDLVMTWSDQESLRTRDFEEMSRQEMDAARAAMARMALAIRPRPTRRFRPDPTGARVDMRSTLRTGLRSGSALIPLRWRSPVLRPPPLVVLCDVSGSMDRYARMLLHFIHALTNARDRVHTFLFGTRLTNVTRALRHRDVDLALDRVGKACQDQGANVLLITDGLDREGGAEVGREAERLRGSCRRLVWLNPLLRYEGFEPLAGGIRALLPHVDDHRPVHNLESLEALADALATGWSHRSAVGLHP
jgi:uncharacterized protein with von Willebrand factor type A (vWA) domain